MQAVICTRYGPPDVLQLRDVETPVARADEILIRIRATTVTSSDVLIRTAVRSARLMTQIMMRLAIGITKPRRRILGMVVAGEVAAVGARVTRFHPGDRVFAFTKLRLGAYAQYIALPESSVVARAPANLSDDESAAIPYGGLLASYFLGRAVIRHGQRVLIYGASGAIGSAALQLAKHFGAHVTAVCGPTNLALVSSLGADDVIDYTTTHTLPDGQRYDQVFDAVGRRKTSALKDVCRYALTSTGKYLSVDRGSPRFTVHDLELLADLAEAGPIKPVIDRLYSLEEIVDAHRYVGDGHKKGNVVVTVAHGDT